MMIHRASPTTYTLSEKFKPGLNKPPKIIKHIKIRSGVISEREAKIFFLSFKYLTQAIITKLITKSVLKLSIPAIETGSENKYKTKRIFNKTIYVLPLQNHLSEYLRDEIMLMKRSFHFL